MQNINPIAAHTIKPRINSFINTLKLFPSIIAGKTEKKIAPTNPPQIAAIKLSTTILWTPIWFSIFLPYKYQIKNPTIYGRVHIFTGYLGISGTIHNFQWIAVIVSR